MKKIALIALTLICGLWSADCMAQDDNFEWGAVMYTNGGSDIYCFYQDEFGVAKFSENGTKLTINGKTFNTSDIARMSTSVSEGKNESLAVVTFDDDKVYVCVYGDIVNLVDFAVDGNHVTATTKEKLDKEITYIIQGKSSNGSFTLNSAYKCTIELSSLELTSDRGPAIDIEDGKRISVIVNGRNKISDTEANTGKAAFYVKGHAEFEGDGILSISSYAKHAYSSKEYTQLKKKFTGNFTILNSASDGIHVGQYFQQNAGTITISNIAGDGIQIEAAADGEEGDGNAIIKGGKMNITVDGTACDGIKADSLVTISGGNITITNNGGAEYSSKKEKVSGSAGISGNAFEMSAGKIDIRATGAGGKGISTDSKATFTDGTVQIVTLGNVYEENGDDTKPQCIKADQSIYVNGGDVKCYSQYGKGFSYDDEGTGEFHVNGGVVVAVGEKKSETNGGSQASQTYSKQNIESGKTYEYDGVSFTAPEGFNHSSAKVLVSRP